MTRQQVRGYFEENTGTMVTLAIACSAGLVGWGTLQARVTSTEARVGKLEAKIELVPERLGRIEAQLQNISELLKEERERNKK